MPAEAPYQDEELRPLNRDDYSDQSGNSIELRSSPSTTSLVLENIHGSSANGDGDIKRPPPGTDGSDSSVEFPKPDADLEDGSVLDSRRSKKARKWSLFWILGGAFTGCWLLVLIYVIVQRYGSSAPSTGWSSAKKPVTLDQVLSGQWRPARQHIEWIEGVNGEDGLLLERDSSLADEYLVVKDVRKRSGEGDDDEKFRETQTLMKVGWFEVDGRRIFPSDVWPSRDLKKVLIISDKTSNWRHSYNGTYWLLEVATQTAEPLDPSMPDAPIQLARWSPKSDSVAFVRDNNLFLRKLSSVHVVQITRDGGAELFYGVPDWVYEEEVFSGNSAMWWAEDGAYLAFLRTNESLVPDYPIQYFVSRPSGERPPKGLENYPEIREIKYPKSGAPNPVVDMQFYDVSRDEVFDVAVEGDFPDEDRLITEVVWAGSSGRVLVRETNRESDILRISLVDVHFRSGRVIRTEDVNALDQGWFEVSQDTQYVPADPARGRPDDGYIDTVIHDGYDHLAYYSPLENADPTILTSGTWEVVSAPAAVDLTNNLVYFVATKESPTQRHLYSVKLDGTGLSAVTEASKEGYYEASFSKGAGYALLTYNGPEIPWQEVISTPSNPDQYVEVIEENAQLRDLAAQHDLPVEIYQNVTIDGYTLQVVERRPPHFDPRKKYPVLFHLYGGPGSQTVNKKFTVDFQAYVASNLGYVVVTVDGRGTGFIGRKARCIVRGNIGHYEAHDQIETAKIWARKSYVDEERIAIWGWSYGGFLTLKTIEVDAGRTFSYGMAVAPVTDWKFYDSIYTERYMHTPQHNPTGYTNASISDMQGLQSNVRFLFMHGVADDNVHMQNSLTLLDKLDLAGVENYDVHVFPDSDHSIYFHNANRIVYDRLSNWLINAFNGEWLRTQHASPDKNYRHPGHGLSDTAPQRQGQDQGQEGHYNDDGGHAFKRDLHDIIAVADYSSPL